MDLASHEKVRILEARFHPASKAGQGFVIVGMVVCDQHGATVESATFRANSVKPFDSTRLLEKLEFLVASATGDPFHSLSALRSEYWSFVEAPPGEDDNDRGAA